MAPNPKNMLTFRQRALMILSHGELSTQALENVDGVRAARRRSCSSGAGSNTFASAMVGSSFDDAGVDAHASDCIAAFAAISEPSSTNCETSRTESVEIVDLTKDTADLEAPTLPLKKIKRK